MSRLTTVFRLRLRSVFRKTRVEQELDEELQYHLDRQIEEGLKSGLSPDQARYAGLRSLGQITQAKEDCRHSRALDWLENLIQDLRYGIRTLRRSPAFSVVAVLALALGIGANTAVFSVAYGLLWRPLPYANADRLAAVYMNYAARDNRFGTMCVRDFLFWKEHNRAFEEPVLFRTQRMDIARQGGSPEQSPGAIVTTGFFSIAGATPIVGRTFLPGEDNPGTASLAVLSESMWRRRFAASPNIVGSTIMVNGAPATIIGVMPGSFGLPRPETEVWTNLVLNPPTRYGPWFYRGLASLKQGVTLEQAQAELNEIAFRLAQQNPYYKQVALPVLSLRDALLGTATKPAIWVLAGAVALLLLIAVVNVANLMLARATVRQQELALRLSLGASRGRIVRQLLTESVLLAFTGGVFGMVLAWGTIQLIRNFNPGNLPFVDAIRLDWTAFLFILCVSMLTGILFGLAPVLGTARADLNCTIKEGGRSSSPGHARSRTRAGLVVCEIALSLILLVGAGLLLRSFANLQRVSGGFFAPPDRILSMLISLGDRKYDDRPAQIAFYQDVLRRARNLTGVEAAGISDSVPPDRQGNADSFQIEGQTLGSGEMNPVVSAVTAGGDFFAALAVPLIEGRYFTEHDNEHSAPVAIVSQAFANRFFPNRRALGKRVRQGSEPWKQIVGIVGNVKYMGLTADTDPAYYMPSGQAYGRRMFLVVRSSGDAANLAGALRQEIQAIDPGVTLAQITTMEQALQMSISRPRFNTALLSSFAGIALLLAATGIYGLIAYSVAQRTQELGVRMALGAAQTRVLGLVVRQGASLAVLGIAIGLCGSLLLARLLKTMLFGVGAFDVWIFLTASAGIFLVVVMATFIPASRAARISPVVALRYQ